MNSNQWRFFILVVKTVTSCISHTEHDTRDTCPLSSSAQWILYWCKCRL